MNLDLNFVEKYAPANEEPYALNVSVRLGGVVIDYYYPKPIYIA